MPSDLRAFLVPLLSLNQHNIHVLVGGQIPPYQRLIDGPHKETVCNCHFIIPIVNILAVLIGAPRWRSKQALMVVVVVATLSSIIHFGPLLGICELNSTDIRVLFSRSLKNTQSLRTCSCYAGGGGGIQNPKGLPCRVLHDVVVPIHGANHPYNYLRGGT